MMRITLAIGLLVFTAVAIATAAPADPALARLSTLSGDKFDVAFMQALIPIHDEAIEMAMTATLYADHTELLRWNQDAVERQNEQVRKLLAWLQADGASPTERKAGVATASVKKLRTLRGVAMERAYLPMMVVQFDKINALARLASTKAHRTELREFAKATLRADGQDSATLHAWMKRWF